MLVSTSLGKKKRENQPLAQITALSGIVTSNEASLFKERQYVSAGDLWE